MYAFEEVLMRIQEVIRKTGLSRRTIYYYIGQKLITPDINKNNGYHIFSETDIQKLFLIRKLREAGLPLADIRSILARPRTTPFYLHKQLNKLQVQLLSIQKAISELDRLTGQLPVCQSLDQLADMLQDTRFLPDDAPRYQMESRDAQLLAQYLWMAYLDTPVTEYQQFLWQKITQHTLKHASTDLKTMSRYLQYLSPEQIDATNVNQYLRNQKIISLTESDYPHFVKELKHSLLAFASDPLQQEKWNLLYQPVIHPTALFCVSVSGWMREFHPAYRRYYENTHTCCRLLKHFMDSPEGYELKTSLNKALQGNCDVRTGYYGELEVASTFHKSIYALLSPEEIREFLNTKGTGGESSGYS